MTAKKPLCKRCRHVAHDGKKCDRRRCTVGGLSFPCNCDLREKKTAQPWLQKVPYAECPYCGHVGELEADEPLPTGADCDCSECGRVFTLLALEGT